MPNNSMLTKSRLFIATCLGLSYCLYQITFTWLLAPQDPGPLSKYYRMEVAPGWEVQSSPNLLLNRFQRLNNWDSLRFFEIAQYGYHLPTEEKPIHYSDIHQYRANVTNLPTYPLLVRGVQKIFQLPPQYALLISAQLACFVFWVYFFLYLLEKNFSKKAALLAAVTFGFAPGAFYMVCGYSESSLLALEMGLFYWTDRFLKPSLKVQDRKGLDEVSRISLTSWLAVAVHGFLATFSRLPAIPLALYPVLKALSSPPSKARLLTSTRLSTSKLSTNSFLLSLISACGLVSFLVFCQIKFGKWDIYFSLSKLIGQEPDYWAVFKPSSYLPRFFFENTQDSMNRAMVPWLVMVAGISLSLDLLKQQRFALYSIAAGLFYVTLAGKAGGGMDGMIRYALPIYLPLVLCLVTVIHERQQKQAFPRFMQNRPSWAIALLYLFSLSCQAWCAFRYLNGKWVS